MNAPKPPRKRDLKPLPLTDEQLDAMAGLDGFTPEQIAAAQAWGEPLMRALNEAQEDEEE
jgi:hypothetical protein